MKLSREEFEMGFPGMQAESRVVRTERAVPPILQKYRAKIRQLGEDKTTGRGLDKRGRERGKEVKVWK